MGIRFTPATRAVVVSSQEQARKLGHAEIRAEHLLLALLADGGPAAELLRDLGVSQERLAADVATFGGADDDVLQSLGIDLAAVRRRTEETFGPGALDRPRGRRSGLFGTWTGGHLRFADPARRAVEAAFHQALARQHRAVGTEHLLLGLLIVDSDPAARALRRLGVEPADVRTRMAERLRRAA